MQALGEGPQLLSWQTQAQGMRSGIDRRGQTIIERAEMSTLAKPTLDNKAQLADAFAKGSTVKSTAKVTKVFHAPEGYRRLTINLRGGHPSHKKIRMKAIEQDCTDHGHHC
jgi:hypothetical protein